MMICQVVGHVWATKKEEGLNGHKLMIVREVLVVSGSTARRAIGSDDSPIDSAIVGIIDSLEIAKDKGE